MAAKKGIGETVLGWFVVREGEGEGAAPEQEAGEPVEDVAVAADEAEAADEPRPEPRKGRGSVAPRAPTPLDAAAVPPVVAGATPDAAVFAQVYRAADIDDAAQERVEKAISLLETLPSETPQEIKKQIVEASLKAFGIPIDGIIEASAREVQALDAYARHGDVHTRDVLTDAAARVEKLEAQIAEVRRLMELQLATQKELVRATNEQKQRVGAVLAFFGQEAVARVVGAAKKAGPAKS